MSKDRRALLVTTGVNDFGAVDGTPISNQATIMDEIDAAVGTGKPR